MRDNILGDIMNKSLWQEIKLPRFSKLDGDIETDILIIGGGMAGILTAYFLEQKGAKYILVEQNRIATGVTANTTAKITLQHSLCYHKLLKSFGKNIAQGYYLSNKKALQDFERLCENIDCDFEKKENFVYSDNALKLKREIDAFNRICAKAKFYDKIPLPVDCTGAVGVKDQAQFHPLKFLSNIVEGLNICENTKVLEMLGTTAVTQHGKIKAKRVVVATHFPFINKHGSYFLKLYQHRSYVVTLKGAQNVNGMYADDNDKGLSFRNYGDLLLLGGGGHRTGKDGGNYKELRDFARLHYPVSKEVYSFATQDCMSLDKMCYIGKYSANTENMYVATGFNKWGMTGSMCAARILSDMLCGEQNEFSEIFNPSRSILKPQLAINGFESVTNLITPTAKRCPHLGCALKWNKAEHSWDCPCHGSRFDCDGRLLNGPATDDKKL